MLVSLLQGVGTKVHAVRNCGKKGILGFYQPRSDDLVLCMNYVNGKDPDSVWDKLAHEATHKMQACLGGFAISDRYVGRMYRDLGALKPGSLNSLQAYPSIEARYEVEARWMELQQPHVVLHALRTACSRQIQMRKRD